MSDALSGTIGQPAGQASARLPQNFTLAAGDRRVLKVTVFDETGAPLPLADASLATWSLGRTDRSTPVLTKTLEDGVTLATVQAAAGQANCGRLDVLITPADTADLIGEYFHECRVTAADGTTARIFYGRVFVFPSNTGA